MYPNGVAATVPIRNVYLHVTRACNLRCVYCYFSASEALPDELSAVEFAALWPQLVALRPQKVVFTGGEPLVRPDLLDLLRGLQTADPDHHLRRCLNTNGHLVTPELAQHLVGLADEVRVSVDALPERHDALRGEGSLAAALNALECLHEVGFEPKALVTLTTHSLPDLEELLCLLFERGIRQVSLNRLRLIGRARRNAGWQVDAEAVHVALRRAWARCYPDRPAPPEPPGPIPHINCGVGQFLTILPNGDVFPCHVLTQREFRCGNVREEGLLTLCSPIGSLGRLARLDLTEISPSDTSLAGPPHDLCVSEVYAATRSSPAWIDVLPNRLTKKGVSP